MYEGGEQVIKGTNPYLHTVPESQSLAVDWLMTESPLQVLKHELTAKRRTLAL